MVAMRVWVKCMESSARSSMARQETLVEAPSCLARRYITGSINTPISAPMNRQPKGVMPKRRMPTIISTLPRGGWVHS